MKKRITSIFLALTMLISLSAVAFAGEGNLTNAGQDVVFIKNNAIEDKGIILQKDFLLNKLKGQRDGNLNQECVDIKDAELSFAFSKNEIHIKAKVQFSDAGYEMNVKGRPFFDKYIGKEDQKIMLDLSGDPDINVLRMNVYNGKNPIKFMDFDIPASGKPTYYLLVENTKTGEDKLIYGHIDETIFEQLGETAESNDIEKDSTDSDLYKKINNIWAKSKNTAEEFKKRIVSNGGNSSSVYSKDATSNSSEESTQNSTLVLSTMYSYNDKLEWIRLINDLNAAGYDGVNPDDYNLPSYILKGDSLVGEQQAWYHLHYDNYNLAALDIDMAGSIDVNFFLADIDAYWGNWLGDQIDYNFSYGLNNSLNGNVHCVYDESTNKLIKTSNKGLYYSHVKAGVGRVNGDANNPYDTNCINQARVLINARSNANDGSIVYDIWNYISPLAGYVPFGNYVSTVFSYLTMVPGTVSNSYNIYSYGPNYLYQKNNYDQIHVNQVGDTGSYVLSKVGDKVRVEVDLDTYNTYTGIIYWQYQYNCSWWD